jgi:hypothetical protein
LLGRLQSRFPGAVAAFELMWRDFVETSLVQHPVNTFH